jgi:hypothetical protein
LIRVRISWYSLSCPYDQLGEGKQDRTLCNVILLPQLLYDTTPQFLNSAGTVKVRDSNLQPSRVS